MATKKLGSVKLTDTLLVTSVNLATEVTGTLAVTAGGTGQTTYTDGQLLIGNTTGNTLAKATLTAGSGITITNGSGTITIASSAASNVYAPIPSDFGINTTTDATINTRDVTGVADGDQIIVEASFIILNNSAATRVYVFTIDFDRKMLS